MSVNYFAYELPVVTAVEIVTSFIPINDYLPGIDLYLFNTILSLAAPNHSSLYTWSLNLPTTWWTREVVFAHRHFIHSYILYTAAVLALVRSPSLYRSCSSVNQLPRHNYLKYIELDQQMIFKRILQQYT